MAAVRISGLSKSYGAFSALCGLDLEVREKTVFGFLGPNGAGKTTTIRIMAGLIRPDQGMIEIDGAPMLFGSGENHFRFGYLPEQPSFYGWMSGPEYLGFVADIFGLSKAEKASRIGELLELVGLTDAGKKNISGYSNGMKQRLGIAQALVNDPQVLILDEPISALDPIGRKEVIQSLGKLKQEKTVFFSTHVLADVDRICDEVAIINKGRLVTQAPLAELREKYAASILKVDFAEDPGGLLPMLRQKDWVSKVEQEGNQLKIWLKDSGVMDANLPLKALAEGGIGVLSYGLTLPETEDLFVELLEGNQ